MNQPPQATTSPAARKLMLFMHIVFAGSWLGATGAMAFLSMIGLLTDNSELRRSAYLLMSVMDRWLIVPLVLASILSGVVMALRTPWGLFRHYWVMAKLALSLAMVALAVSTVMPWVRLLAEATERGADAIAVAPVSRYLVISACIFLVALWTIVFLAVFKPWGKSGKEQQPSC